MKKILLLLFASFALNSCNKDYDNQQTLPLATTTGQGIFACFVNGKPFIDNSGGFFNCYYQFVDGEYYFSVGGNDNRILPQNIYIQTQKKTISEGEIIKFNTISDGNGYAGVGLSYSITENYQSYTNEVYSGELKITKLDFVNKIVSGSFSFNVVNPKTSEIIEIRDGRFDTLFTQ